MMDLTNRKRRSETSHSWDRMGYSGTFWFWPKLGYTENGNVNRENNDKEQWAHENLMGIPRFQSTNLEVQLPISFKPLHSMLLIWSTRRASLTAIDKIVWIWIQCNIRETYLKSPTNIKPCQLGARKTTSKPQKIGSNCVGEIRIIDTCPCYFHDISMLFSWCFQGDTSPANCLKPHSRPLFFQPSRWVRSSRPVAPSLWWCSALWKPSCCWMKRRTRGCAEEGKLGLGKWTWSHEIYGE